MPVQEIEELKQQFVNQLVPVQIYLFGSFASGTYTDQSDIDFYIVVNDDIKDLAAETTKAYKSIRDMNRRPVDIVVNTVGRFESRKNIPSLENEVHKNGVLIYDAIR